MWRAGSLLAGVVAIAAVVVLLAPGELPHGAVGVVAGAAALLAAASARALFTARQAAQAIEQALFELSEGDFSTRLALEGDRRFAVIGLRFNALAARLRADQAERYQRELLLEAVLEATPSAVLLLDPGERVVFANVASRELLSGGARLEGQSLAELTARARPGLRDALTGAVDGLITEGDDTYLVAQRRLELRYLPHRLLMVKPLTRDLLRREADAWKRAIRVISHELNNALAPISSLVNTARQIAHKPEYADKLEEAFVTIAGRTAYLQQFLDGYAQFARLPLPVRQPVAWQPLLEQLQALHPFVMPAVLPDETASLDPAQLRQMLTNLLKNAAESGSAPEHVKVTVVRTPDATVIEVSDRGHGMNETLLAQVVTPFHSTKKTGSGLGLALSREIVEAHGGQLTISSAVGSGTTVRCVFPC